MRKVLSIQWISSRRALFTEGKLIKRDDEFGKGKGKRRRLSVYGSEQRETFEWEDRERKGKVVNWTTFHSVMETFWGATRGRIVASSSRGAERVQGNRLKATRSRDQVKELRERWLSLWSIFSHVNLVIGEVVWFDSPGRLFPFLARTRPRTTVASPGNPPMTSSLPRQL